MPRAETTHRSPAGVDRDAENVTFRDQTGDGAVDAPAGAEPSGDRPQRRRMDYRPTGADASPKLVPTLKRTLLEFREDGMTDWAAALTYYGLLALFPALIALVSLVGLFGDPVTTTGKLTDIVNSIGPRTAATTFAGPIRSITSNRGASGILFVAGLGAALWSASGYVGAFMRAANIAYETPEGRPFWKLRPLQIVVTLAMVVLLALLALALVLTGPVVDQIAHPLGISGAATTAWDIAKWPVMVLVVLLMIAVLFHAAPNVRLPGFKWVTPGAVLALVAWVLASAAFAFYVANFGSYDKTYGTLGGVVAMLVWLWIGNLALLLGMELNAERERSRELAAGVPGAERELQLDARSAPKRKRTT